MPSEHAQHTVQHHIRQLDVLMKLFFTHCRAWPENDHDLLINVQARSSTAPANLEKILDKMMAEPSPPKEVGDALAILETYYERMGSLSRR